ncbi:PA14 domain-containing protein [Pseudanabaena sp. PCC 6802]|uniref:PA14 domain-containing protein n=1 Tax=Pseudanabaena sp. PCC 6802 TaxID=118173 RepID=UPI00034BE080|nr:PA14 domain-containing protein [Pseudanabaena sp. PCC 6802]
MENIRSFLHANDDFLPNINTDSQTLIGYGSDPCNLSHGSGHRQSAISSKELGFLDDHIIASWLERYPKIEVAVLREALRITVEHLAAFATSTDFPQKMGLTFGDSLLNNQLTNLHNEWLEGDYWNFPNIKILPGEQLNGAFGAFGRETNTIYLAQDYIARNAANPETISSVLLEELGHFVDSKINLNDAPGDEGAIFAALVQSGNLDNSTFQALKAKDDSATITLGEKVIQVEQATTDTGNGLRGEYFDNANLTNLKQTRTDSTVNFNWGTGSPDAAIASNTFSARWTGQILPTTSGTYTFFVQADDGVRLWVNGRRLINDWEDYGTVRERRGTISLNAGLQYDIRLEYFEESGQASAVLLWSGPGVTKQVIPQSQLFSTSLVDSTLPTATATAANVTTAGSATYDFTVTYSDNVAVNASTIDGSDVRITGPNNFDRLASLVSINPSGNGTPRTATYRITAPGDAWDNTDNGTYTLALQANQVSDTSGNFVAANTLGTFLVNLMPPSSGENTIFPADAGVINVKDFGAKGDGGTDDTVAIQSALNAFPNGKRIIYLPNGTYLVSKTLSWPEGSPGTGDDFKNTILQGQSEGSTIIKLVDDASDFNDPNNPKAVIFTGPAPAQRFGNSIRNLTVDTGNNNPGAIGIQFNASNQGSMRQVTVRSGDGQGIVGLDFDFTDEIGPLLVKDVTVNGFQYGIQSGYTVNSQTFENITLQNQSVYGFWNYSQVVNIRNLTSTNSVPAIYNALADSFNPNGLGHMTLLNASLKGIGSASSQPAIVNGGTLLARGIATTGYQSAIASGSTTISEPTVNEFVSKPVTSLFTSPAQTLNLPIRETPDVPWDNLTDWANVVSFGAVPNDGLDDTVAIQAAIDSGSTTVYLPVGSYNLQDTVFIRNNVRRIIGTEALVDVPNTVNPGFKVVNGSSPVVVFERISSGFASTPTLENASARTLVIRDAINVAGNMTGSGDVFIENVVSSPFQNWTFNGQNVWARQFNVENSGTHITNNGGNLWILGLKTERGGTLIDTRGGGKTELLGGLAYTTTPGPDGTQNSPMFINNESSVSFSLAEVNYGAPNYTTYIRETRGGVTRDLSGSSLPNYWGSGKDIPLYVGYSGN